MRVMRNQRKTKKMSRGSIKHMLQVASKKAALGDIVKSIEEYTEADIDAMVTQPVWIRTRLKQHRENILCANRMDDMIIPEVTEECHLLYPVRRYVGNTTQTLTNGKGFTLDIDPKDIMTIIGDGKLKVNSTNIVVTSDEYIFLMDNSEFVDIMSITDYNEYLQNVLEEKFGTSSKETDQRDTEYGYMSAIRFDK